MVMGDAKPIPVTGALGAYGTGTLSTFVSSSIDLDKVIYNSTFNQDLTSFSFK